MLFLPCSATNAERIERQINIFDNEVAVQELKYNKQVAIVYKERKLAIWLLEEMERRENVTCDE